MSIDRFHLEKIRDADIIDSRDVDAEIERLEGEAGVDELDEEDAELLRLLTTFRDEDATAEWQYGAGFIRESYWEEYARETAESIGAIDRDAHWPLNCIDWEQAADELKADYTSVELDGDTYYTRA